MGIARSEVFNFTIVERNDIDSPEATDHRDRVSDRASDLALRAVGNPSVTGWKMLKTTGESHHEDQVDWRESRAVVRVLGGGDVDSANGNLSQPNERASKPRP